VCTLARFQGHTVIVLELIRKVLLKCFATVRFLAQNKIDFGDLTDKNEIKMLNEKSLQHLLIYFYTILLCQQQCKI